jgi:hypothetical protein
MKKTLYRIFLLTLTLTVSNLQAQQRSIYMDAVDFANLYHKYQSDSVPSKIPIDASVIDVLEYYIPGGDLEAEISRNIFLKEYFKTGGSASATEGTRNSGALKNNALSKIAGLDVTNIANAVADVMIEHAKQELTISFFNRFKDFVDENPEFRILFPKTTDNLQNLLAHKYPEMLPALRTSFLDDVRQLTFRLDDVLDLPRYRELFKDLPEVRIAIRSLRLVHELETGASNAADVIKEFSSFEEWQTETLKETGGYLGVAAFFSESIRTTKTDMSEVWISGDELKKLFYDKDVFSIYLGLLYQQAFKDPNLGLWRPENGTLKFTAFPQLLLEQKDDLFTLQNKLKEFFDLAGKVNVSYHDIKTKSGAVSNEDYYAYISTSLDAVDYGFSLAKVFGADIQRAQKYLSVLRRSNELYKNIYTKEYNQAMVNALDLLSQITSLVKEKNLAIRSVDASAVISGKSAQLDIGNSLTVKKVNDSYQVIDGKNTNKIIRSYSSLDVTLSENNDRVYIASSKIEKVDPLEKLFVFIDKVKPYALFIANMIEADTEEEIRNAIENAILPVGSSGIKKHSVFNVSIQSYLGARVNMFKPAGAQNSWNESWGVIAPVGIGFSWGGRAKQPASYSLFVSVFDIGAIVDYKLTTDPGATRDYEIKLGQIFSPGGYFVWGLPWELPISLGIGTQYGPGIYKTGNGIEDADPEWKLNAFLAVDIPFFNLYNRARDSRRK